VTYCSNASILGEPFAVMTYREGEVVPLGADLPERYRHAAARERFAMELIETLAAIHAVPIEPFVGDCDRVTPADQVARSVERLETATRATGHEVPTLWSVADGLQEHAPTDTATTLVHGDYRPGNVCIAGAEWPAVTGVLDWETAFLGDPRTELGYLLLRWRDPDDPEVSLEPIAARHPNTDALATLRIEVGRG
jgi:aminoglycoside phosphotransferase (APT) family kinase protein